MPERLCSWAARRVRCAKASSVRGTRLIQAPRAKSSPRWLPRRRPSLSSTGKAPKIRRAAPKRGHGRAKAGGPHDVDGANARFTCRDRGCHTAHGRGRSEEHTSELQSRLHLVCRLLLEKKKKNKERCTAGLRSARAA